jgi:hypothetical protein
VPEEAGTENTHSTRTMFVTVAGMVTLSSKAIDA